MFYGFTSDFEGGTCNTWYCHEGESELHTKSLGHLAGPVLARHRVVIDWNDRQQKPFCKEEREVTAYAVAGGTLVEWSSRLSSMHGTVTLDGDPHHAGFQFRADNSVVKQAKKTYFVRVEGKGELGQERNDKSMTNLPWEGMCFLADDTRFTAVYIDNPRNPKPSFYSERLYGRLGL